MKASTKSTDKVFHYFAVSIVIASFLVSFFELPPATFLIKIYCSIFETNSYPVTLIGLILILLVLIPFALIKKLYDRKISKVEDL